MPQLDKLTYSTQIFWLLVCFTSFYFILLKNVLPNILLNIKTRESIINTTLNANSDSSLEVKQADEKFIQVNNEITNLTENFLKTVNKNLVKNLEYIPSVINSKIIKITNSSNTQLQSSYKLIKV